MRHQLPRLPPQRMIDTTPASNYIASNKMIVLMPRMSVLLTIIASSNSSSSRRNRVVQTYKATLLRINNTVLSTQIIPSGARTLAIVATVAITLGGDQATPSTTSTTFIITVTTTIMVAIISTSGMIRVLRVHLVEMEAQAPAMVFITMDLADTTTTTANMVAIMAVSVASTRVPT